MLGVCYYPEHWPEAWWAEDAAAMAAMGITYVRIGEFAWQQIEPDPGRFDWGWLDRAMDVLGGAGLKVVLGTPTPTPPKWLVDLHPDILPHGPDGAPRGFGSRRHYSFSSRVWWQESARIVEAIAQRYGTHDALAGWQTDNEYGCHDTTLSYGPEDLLAFRGWLRRRYQSPETLNEAWGNAFWSMAVRSFDEVTLPAMSVTETAPAARLDYRRFSSDQVAAYNRMQVEILRRLSPGRFVTHNFMGFFHEFDHWDVAADLDFASWDSYPLGKVEAFRFTDAERVRWARTSHPDIPGFHHDLYRSVGHGRFWIMEQQPGPVNWAPWNAVPAPGMVRLWAWQALAHGADVVSYFRWRQAPFAQEQMHAGLHRPDRARSPGGEEVARAGQELAAFGAWPRPGKAPVALVFDYEASWITRIQPQGADFDYAALVHTWYEAARRWGVNVDVVRQGASLEGYRLVLVPCLPHVSEAALSAFRDADGSVVFGPRTGSKTRNFSIPLDQPPGPLQELLGLRVSQVASMRPGLTEGITGEGLSGTASRWREWIETDCPVLARFEDGTPALVGSGGRFYLGAWTDEAFLRAMMGRLLSEAGVATTELPQSVRLQRRGGLVFAINYGPDPWQAPVAAGARFRLGGPVVPPCDVACWED